MGFPCNQFGGQEPGSNEEVKSFCTGNYNVTFQMFEKIDVRGETAHPLYDYLCSKQPFLGFKGLQGKALEMGLKAKFGEFFGDDSVKWNFTKFLVDREGNVVGRFEPNVNPDKISGEIEKYL